ncbi:MAG: isoprenylcysteine carboxylmethyltransferase family protein [Bauldia sp.]
MSRTRDYLVTVQSARTRLLWGAFLVAVPAASVFAPVWPPGVWQRVVLHDAGLLLLFAGIVGRTWCSLYISGRKIDALVDRGPYSVVRNPLYLFSAVAAAGIGAVFGSLVVAVAAFATCIGAFTIVVTQEERTLLGLLGPAYGDYLARVPRFVPRPALWRDEDTLTIHTPLVRRTFLDALWFLAVSPWQWAVEHLQNSGVLPVILRLP